MASSEAAEKYYAKLFFFCVLILYKTYSANGACIASKSSGFGRPQSSIILSI